MLNQWSVINALPPLEDNEVQLWRIDLAAAAGAADRFTSLLSSSEKAHAGRRRAGQVRDHFTIGRACLRVLIGNAQGMDPRDVAIVKGVHGKLETPAIGGRSLSFNLAHSSNTLLIALRRQGAVGVDVEHFDRSTDIMEVAQANFTEDETNSLAALTDPETRIRTFYRYWTRKEAIGKADGRGLLLPLASFDVSFASMNSHPIRVNESPDKEGKLYFVTDLYLGDRIAGALALESAESRVTRLIFPPAYQLPDRF
jgi:4'-phosphopantetheinyl transferase